MWKVWGPTLADVRSGAVGLALGPEQAGTRRKALEEVKNFIERLMAGDLDEEIDKKPFPSSV
jgi:hypothetical protein